MLPKLILNIERWKYNKTFELYVSNMGHIRNKSKADIAPKIMENGYMVVYVNGSINGYMLLHRVVMLTWKPTPEAEQLTVDHLDHNKRNNALYNLEWVSRGENLKRARRDFCNSRPIDYEYIENITPVSGNPNTKRAKKATAKIKTEEAINRAMFSIIPATDKNSANKNRPTLTFIANDNGYNEVAEATRTLTQFNMETFKKKIEAILTKVNVSKKFTYCGMHVNLIIEGEKN